MQENDDQSSSSSSSSDDVQESELSHAASRQSVASGSVNASSDTVDEEVPGTESHVQNDAVEPPEAPPESSSEPPTAEAPPEQHSSEPSVANTLSEPASQPPAPGDTLVQISDPRVVVKEQNVSSGSEDTPQEHILDTIKRHSLETQKYSLEQLGKRVPMKQQPSNLKASVPIQTFVMENPLQPSQLKQGNSALKPANNATYIEFPSLLDGFLLDVYSVELDGLDLKYIVEEDLELFTKLNIIKAGDNQIRFEALGSIPHLRVLWLPCNNLKTLDINAAINFPYLEEVDVSFNSLDQAAILFFAALPALRHLDLSCNHINELPAEIADMRDWWKNFSGRNSPSSAHRSTHARRLTDTLTTEENLNRQKMMAEIMHKRAATFSFASEQYKVSYSMPGFLKLDSLNLENNEITETDFVEVLGAMPSLRRLNVSKNQITSLARIVELTYNSQPNTASVKQNSSTLPNTASDRQDSPTEANAGSGQEGEAERTGTRSETNTEFKADDSLNQKSSNASSQDAFPFASKESVNGSEALVEAPKKYMGFPNLEELKISDNLISSVPDLMGLVCLPALSRVFLNGNPVMNPRHRPSNQRGIHPISLIAPADFNVLFELPNTYGIEVCDSVYSSKKGALDEHIYKYVASNDAVGMKMKKVPRAREDNTMQIPRKNAAKFSGHMLAKRPMATIINHLKREGKRAFPHNVQEIKDMDTAGAADRNQRRRVHYTDDEIAKMIKMGRVFTLNELGRILNPANKTGDEGDDDDDDEDTESDEEQDYTSSSRRQSTATSASFRQRAGSALLGNPEDESAGAKTFITGVNIEQGNDVNALQDSCDSDEESMDIKDDESGLPPVPPTIQESIRALKLALTNPASYERVHETSYSQHTFVYRRRLREVLPRYSLPPSKTHARRQTAPILPPSRAKAKILPPLSRSGLGFRRLPADAFAEMQQDMQMVEDKLRLVETNLNSVLGKPLTRAERGRRRVVVKDDVYKGKSLMKDVRETYERIQREYTAAALDNMAEEQAVQDLATPTAT